MAASAGGGRTAKDDDRERATRFVDLFERVTGQSSVTEHQQADVGRDGSEAGQSVSDYLRTATADGLDDAIADPDPY
jgi:hypothetical protein